VDLARQQPARRPVDREDVPEFVRDAFGHPREDDVRQAQRETRILGSQLDIDVFSKSPATRDSRSSSSFSHTKS
jgi:hypothetical protein